jgi:hypothetical protein
LAHRCSKDLSGFGLCQDYKDVIIYLKRAKHWEKLDFSPKTLLRHISSMGLEAYKALATADQLLLTSPVTAASRERAFSKMKLIKSHSAFYSVTRQIHKPCFFGGG